MTELCNGHASAYISALPACMLSLLLSGALAREASACTCGIDASISEKIELAHAIFRGRVMQATAQKGDEPHINYTVYEFEVTAPWKHLNRQKVEVWVLESTCADRFQVWNEYIVYARPLDSRASYETDMCQRNVHLKQVAGNIEESAALELEELGPPIWQPNE